MLDPIADKLLVGTALLMLVHDNTIDGVSIWAAVIVLCREILVSGLREYLAELNVKVRVTQLAKWKTAVQMVALAILLIGPTLAPYHVGDAPARHRLPVGRRAADAVDRLRLPEGCLAPRRRLVRAGNWQQGSWSRSSISPGCASGSARPRRPSSCRPASPRSPISSAGSRARGPEYATAFAKPEVVRAAIDQTHVKPAASIAGAREIAFFPPVTGG